MTAISVSAPFPILTDIDGDPLDAGYVYIGQANLDPAAFPKAAYWDASLTTPAAQPIRTSGGYPVRNGSPARIYTDGDYSIRINNKNGTLVYSSPASTDRLDSWQIGYDGGTVQGVLDAVTGTNGAAYVGYQPAGTGAAPTTVQSKLRESVSVFDFMTAAQIADVQSASPSIDVTLAINTAAAAVRSLGKNLFLPTVKSHYPISSTVDLSGIKNIDGRGALLKGTFSGSAAAIIGDVNEGSIWLEVRNTTDKSDVDGTVGIKLLGMNATKCWLYARGFDEGLLFDGVSANRSWVGNEFNIISLYNNGSHVHFNMAGSSYAVHNQFRGGSYYLGTNQLKAARGTIKATLAGTSLLSEVVFHDPEIGISGGSRDADHGMFVYATSATSSTGNTIFFRKARLELYSSSAFVPYYVNIPTTTSGNIGVDIEALAMPLLNAQMNIGSLKSHNVILNYTGVAGTSHVSRQLSNIRPTFPYQVNGRIYVPERILFNASYSSPAQFITDSVGSSGPNRAIGDGTLLSQSTAVAIGTKWKKNTAGLAVFLKMSVFGQFVVICYDAAGNILSGTSPWYCVMRNSRSASSGGETVYQGFSDWIFIHPDVDSFFIGWAAWSDPAFYSDPQFEVFMGPTLTRVRTDETGPNMIATSSSVQSYMQAGAALDAPTAVYRNELLLKTTTTAASASGANTITLADVTGINTNCQLGVELDTVITGSERRYQHCSVTNVTGNVVTISPVLTANVASGRRVLVNKWIIR